MIIGIEATRANKAHRTGVEWYAWHVIQELKKQTTRDGNSWILYSKCAGSRAGSKFCRKIGTKFVQRGPFRMDGRSSVFPMNCETQD